jgi:hypothetical protein
MEEGLRQADAVVALFSGSYFERDRWTNEEWTAVVARRDRIIPLAVEPLTNHDVPAMLATRVRKDLHGLDEEAALEALLTAVDGGGRPSSPPPFPGGAAPAREEPEAPGTDVAEEARSRLPDSTKRAGVWNVRRKNPDFSGREAVLVALREGLLADNDTAVHALHGRGGIPGIPEQQAHALSGDLGDLPLALAQAAGVIGNGMTVDRYRRLLTESTARIL